MNRKYLTRIVDKTLDFALECSGAVLIEGPKWCGKTSTATEKAKSILLMQEPDRSESYKKAADTKPSILLRGKKPRLIDEWQSAPVLWDAIRFEVDKQGKSGLFILTGSSVPSDNATEHTGTGRISRMLMRPMSLFESLESNGEISLKSLFDGEEFNEGFSELSIEKLAFVLSRGGWPASIGAREKVALKKVSDYVKSVISIDISKVDGVEKDPERVKKLMRSLARNISTMASMQTIIDDMATDDITLSDKTVSSYLNALRRIFVIEDLPAWSPAMRSKTTIRTSSKRNFIDPSIAVSVLSTNPNKLLDDFCTFGFLFESLCIRDLRVYAEANDGKVFHYRDRNELEIDAIVELDDGRWGAVEIKMGAKEIEKAAENLKNFKNKIDVQKMKEPSFLMVLTATEIAYKRNDGVLVVPIGCLKD